MMEDEQAISTLRQAGKEGGPFYFYLHRRALGQTLLLPSVLCINITADNRVTLRFDLIEVLDVQICRGYCVTCQSPRVVEIVLLAAIVVLFPMENSDSRYNLQSTWSINRGLIYYGIL